MTILFIFMDLIIFCIVITGTYFIHKKRNRKKDTLKNIKYNMEVFHDSDMLLKHQNNYDIVWPNNFPINNAYDEGVDKERVFSHDDGNDLMRERINNKRFANSNDLAEKIATPFSHGGMNIQNENNNTNYLNF